MSKILIFGDSHVAILKTAQDELLLESPDTQLETMEFVGVKGKIFRNSFFDDNGHSAVFTDSKIKERLSQLPLLESYDYYGLSIPLHAGLFFRNKAWSKYAPFQIAKGEVPVSGSVIRAGILSDQKYTFNLIDVLLRNGVRVFVVEPPRPFRRHPIFKEARPEVALYADKVYRETITAELTKKGIPIITIPEETIDDEGYMKDDFRAERENDIHHGNSKFGCMMLSKIQSLCDDWPF